MTGHADAGPLEAGRLRCAHDAIMAERAELLRLIAEHDAKAADQVAEFRGLMAEEMRLRVRSGEMIGQVLRSMRARARAEAQGKGKRTAKISIDFYRQGIAAALEEGVRLLSPA